MCLAAFALNARPDLPFVLIANRDEFHARPTAPAAPWAGQPGLVAGRDLSAGGTWLGIAAPGRYALLTNYRDPSHVLPDAPSRGALVQGFLSGMDSPRDYAHAVHARGADYNGFNLVVGDAQGAWYAGNRDGAPRALADGVHGLSNHLLDTPWPKVVRTCEALQAWLAEGALPPSPAGEAPDLRALWRILADRRAPPDAALPDTGVGLARERLLGSPMIVSETYGTRCASVLLLRPGVGLSLHELQYRPDGSAGTQADWLLPADTRLPAGVAVALARQAG